MVDVPRNTPDRKLTAQFELISRAVDRLGGDGPDADALVAFAADAVPHTDHAGLTVVHGTRPPVTVAATDPVPALLDSMQVELGAGPLVDPVEGEDMVVIDDLTTDTQWTRFGELVTSGTDVRSMFAIRVRVGDADRAVLAFYSRATGAFGSVDRGVGVICATFASLVLQRDEAVRRPGT